MVYLSVWQTCTYIHTYTRTHTHLPHSSPSVSASQSPNSRYFGLDNSLLWACPVTCRMAGSSPVPLPPLPASSLPPPDILIRTNNVSKQCQESPGEQNLPWWESLLEVEMRTFSKGEEKTATFPVEERVRKDANTSSLSHSVYGCYSQMPTSVFRKLVLF